MDRYLVVLAGAGLGGLTRYALGTWIMAKSGGRFPLGTFLINISGSFFIGLLMTLLTERLHPHPNWRLFLVVGGPGWLHDIFELRVRDAAGCPRWRALDGSTLCSGQCAARLRGCLAGRGAHRPPIMNMEAQC